MIEFVVSVL